MALMVSNVSVCNAGTREYHKKCFHPSCNNNVQKILVFIGKTHESKVMFANKLGFVSLDGTKYIGACRNHFMYLDVLKNIMKLNEVITKNIVDELCCLNEECIYKKYVGFSGYIHLMDILSMYRGDTEYTPKTAMKIMNDILILYLTAYMGYERFVSIRRILTRNFLEENMFKLGELMDSIYARFVIKSKIFQLTLSNSSIEDDCNTMMEIVRDSDILRQIEEAIKNERKQYSEHTKLVGLYDVVLDDFQ